MHVELGPAFLAVMAWGISVLGGLKLTMMVTSEYNERVTWCLIMSIESQRAGIKVCLLLPHQRNPNIAIRYAAWGNLCGTPAYLIIDICDGHQYRRIMVMWRPTRGCCKLGVSSCYEPSPLCRGVWFIADGTVALGNIGILFLHCVNIGYITIV